MKVGYTLIFLLTVFAARSQDFGWQTIYSAGSNVIQYRIVVHHVKYLGDAGNGWVTKVFCRSTFQESVEFSLIGDVAYENDASYHGKTKMGALLGWGVLYAGNNRMNEGVNDYVRFENIRFERLKIGSQQLIKSGGQTGNYQGSNGPNNNNQSGYSGSNVANRPPNKSGGIPYGDDAKCLNCDGKGNPSLPPPPGRQKGIPYGNDARCLNCGNENRSPLPPPNQPKPKGIPYGNDSKCLNCGTESKVTLSPPGRSNSYVQTAQVAKNQAADNDDISKIDSSNPEEVLKWTTRQAEKAINELEELARLTKCPATAAAYRKLVEYSRCALKGGNCGLPPEAEIPDCPADL